MTTESTPGTRTGLFPLLGAVGAGAMAVLAIMFAASVSDGRPAVVGAGTGGALTLVVFAVGIAVVSLVARLMPVASMLVALMTYALQLLVLALCVVAIDRADVGSETLSREWFAAGVIAVTLLWLLGHLVVATRQRIPLYDTTTTKAAADRLVDHPGVSDD